jgi:hypothetical protein
VRFQILTIDAVFAVSSVKGAVVVGGQVVSFDDGVATASTSGAAPTSDSPSASSDLLAVRVVRVLGRSRFGALFNVARGDSYASLLAQCVGKWLLGAECSNVALFVCLRQTPVVCLLDASRPLFDSLQRLLAAVRDAELCLLPMADAYDAAGAAALSPRHHEHVDRILMAVGLSASRALPAAARSLSPRSPGLSPRNSPRHPRSPVVSPRRSRASTNHVAGGRVSPTTTSTTTTMPASFGGGRVSPTTSTTSGKSSATSSVDVEDAGAFVDMLTRLGVEGDDVALYADDPTFTLHLSSLVDEYGGIDAVASRPKIANSLFAMAQMLSSDEAERHESQARAPVPITSSMRRLQGGSGSMRRRESPLVVRRGERQHQQQQHQQPMLSASPPPSSSRGSAHRKLPVSASSARRTENNRRHSTMTDSQPRSRSATITSNEPALGADVPRLALPRPPPPSTPPPPPQQPQPQQQQPPPPPPLMPLMPPLPNEPPLDGWYTAREEQAPALALLVTGALSSSVGAKRSGTTNSANRVVSPLRSSKLAAFSKVAATAASLSESDRVALLRIQRVVRHWLARRRLVRSREQLRRRAHIVAEMKTTEESFVAQLEEIRDVFLVPLKLKGLLSDADLKLLSLNVPLLLNMHVGLRDDLRARAAGWTRAAAVGDVFLKLVPFLKLHAEYVKSYDVAVQRLTELRADAAFSAFMRTCSSAARAGLSGDQYLQTLLIAPVQRIPRYEMLLGECIKATPALHADHEALRRALDGVRAVATHINDMKKVDDTLRRIAALQRVMIGSVERISWLSVEGRLLRHKHVARSFSKPTTCAACKRMIWGLRNKGFQCRQCGVSLHRSHKCANADFSLCEGARSDKDSASGSQPTQLFAPGRRLIKEAELAFQLPHFPLCADDGDGDDAPAAVVSERDGGADTAAWSAAAPLVPCLVLLFNDVVVIARRRAEVVDDVQYEFFTRMLFDHNSLARSATQLVADESAEAGRPCLRLWTVSGNRLRLFFDDADACEQWLDALRSAYARYAPG